ncbi:receptor-type tyrosine-protein kinase FLT3-like isoform X3 [Astatotilapia calliptera]|uniref:receptor-type tyrosine-protein kinase FLT3-like isoform X3 n=1 Tax=Astatotilapia calliptera TaxID=8154 RepID=UPI000E412B09|nr:receptor-type tyrosine-protein kinase FLT3-like isoform X3 [Astatotilapia calliptera]
MTARNGSQSMVTSQLSETDSGEYTLTCESNNVTMFSTTVILHVMKRPTKPQLMLDGVDVSDTSPRFKCVSVGFPNPTITWSGNKNSDEAKMFKESDGRKESKVSSTEYYNTGMMCCATNTEGQECSQLYDYDLQSSVMNKDEVSTVTLSEGQSLLLRCRVTGYSLRSPVWEKGGKQLNARTFSCTPEKKEEIAYLSIRSVREEHSGTYTCTSANKNSKSVHVNVSDEGFLSAQLDETKIISAQEASSTCLQATVSYHPVLQYCSWETPDKNRTKCVRETWVTQHRTVKLCDPLISGDYKLHLEAGGQKETKTISVCVVDEPKFNFLFNKDDGTLNLETVSLVPANYTWMFCSEFNHSCSESDSSWDEVPNAFKADSDVSCNKPIKSSVRRELGDGHHLKFCLTNSVGSWCQSYHIIIPPTVQYSIGKQPQDIIFLLKAGNITLFLVLVVVSTVLIFFIKKKNFRSTGEESGATRVSGECVFTERERSSAREKQSPPLLDYEPGTPVRSRRPIRVMGDEREETDGGVRTGRVNDIRRWRRPQAQMGWCRLVCHRKAVAELRALPIRETGTETLIGRRDAAGFSLLRRLELANASTSAQSTSRRTSAQRATVPAQRATVPAQRATVPAQRATVPAGRAETAPAEATRRLCRFPVLKKRRAELRALPTRGKSLTYPFFMK